MDNELIEKRKAGLDQFVTESFSVIVDFADRLGINDPHKVLTDFNCLKDFIFSTVNDFVKSQIIKQNDRAWIITRIGYLLGEYFKEKYSGYWTVNENRNSKQFGHYVIFVKSSNGSLLYPIDVFSAAMEYIDQNPDRNLASLIKEIEAEIK